MRNLILTQNGLPKVRQALVEGMKVSSTASKKSTYYHTGDEQSEAIRKLVLSLYDLGKELPLVIATQPSSSGFFIQEVILNELKMSTKRGGTCVINPLDWDDDKMRDRAIMACLDNLETNGTPYVLRMFMEAKKRRINNARSRRIMLRWILSHPKLEYMAVKYRAKLRNILTHAWGLPYTKIVEEVCLNPDILALHSDMGARFDKVTKPYITFPYPWFYIIMQYIFTGTGYVNDIQPDTFPTIRAALIAHTDIFQANVPLEVLIGSISNVSHPQHTELWGTVERRKETLKRLMEMNKTVTETQKMRQTKLRSELGVEEKADAKKVIDPIALLKTTYEGQGTDEIDAQIKKLAKDHKIELPYKLVGVVLDKSQSMEGHRQESKNTPRAIADFAFKILVHSMEYGVFCSETARDTTDLASSFLHVVEERGGKKPEAVFIISDGYENSADGLLEQVVDAYNAMETPIPVFHLSPIGAAEYGGAVRPLGKNIASLPADYRGLASGIATNFLTADPAKWLQMQFRKIEERATR